MSFCGPCYFSGAQYEDLLPSLQCLLGTSCAWQCDVCWLHRGTKGLAFGTHSLRNPWGHSIPILLSSCLILLLLMQVEWLSWLVCFESPCYTAKRSKVFCRGKLDLPSSPHLEQWDRPSGTPVDPDTPSSAWIHTSPYNTGSQPSQGHSKDRHFNFPMTFSFFYFLTK